MSAPLEIRRYREGDSDAVWALMHLAEGTLALERVPPIDLDDPANRDVLHIDEMVRQVTHLLNQVVGDGSTGDALHRRGTVRKSQQARY